MASEESLVRGPLTGSDLPGHSVDPTQPRISEETVNQITHGAGCLLSLVGAAVLCRWVAFHGDSWQIVGCCVYSATLVAVYGASTLSHSFEQHAAWRHFWRMVDQVCIFLLIAGTYTPFGLRYMRDPAYLALLAAIWLFALVGVFFKIFFARLRNVTTAAYLMLGWLPILAARAIVERVPVPALVLIVAGGVLYSVGTWFLTHDDKVPYFHGVWHLLVMAASACHYFAILFFVAGYPW